MMCEIVHCTLRETPLVTQLYPHKSPAGFI
jgi:hypothetical protein